MAPAVSLRAARATPDEASGATLAIAYVGADASSASPGEVRRDGSPEKRNVKPPQPCTLCTKRESKGCNHLIPQPIQHESTVQI